MRGIRAWALGLLALVGGGSPASGITLHAGDIVVLGWDTYYPWQAIRVDPLTGEQTPFGAVPGFDLAFDSVGSLFVLTNAGPDYGFHPRVYRIDPVSETWTQVAEIPVGALALHLEVDSADQILVTGTVPAGVLRIDPATGDSTVLASGGALTAPQGMAVDVDGSILVADTESVVRLDPTSGDQTVVATGPDLAGAYGIGIEEGSTAVVTTAAGIVRVDLATGATSILGASSAFSSRPIVALPGGVILAAAGSSLVRVDPVSGQETVIVPELAGAPYLGIAAVPGTLPDGDADSVPDVYDNCAAVSNADQLDTDANGVGDACNDAEDADGDDYADALDNCPADPNPTQQDQDGDTLGDACDPFPTLNDPLELQALLAQCSADRASCEAELLTCQDDLGREQAALSQCQQDLADTEAALEEAEAACSDDEGGSCGLGPELGLLMAGLLWLHRRHRAA